MTNNLKRSLNLIWLILSPGNFIPIPLMVVLSLYTLGMLLLIHFMSIAHNGAYILSNEKWVIIAICVGIIEVLNQITFWEAKRNLKIASVLKAVTFWCVFTVGSLAYIYLLSQIEIKENWVWYEDIEGVLIYLIFSWVLPIYSVSPNIRFLLLSGKFGKSD